MLSEITKNKISISLKKVWASGKRKKREPCSDETRKKLSEYRKNHPVIISGENHWNWKGGITSIDEKIRKSFKYRQWRSDVFTRDDFTCQQCDKRGGGRLEAHHIKRFNQILEDNKIKSLNEAYSCEELWNINNGITLCLRCHKNFQPNLVQEP